MYFFYLYYFRLSWLSYWLAFGGSLVALFPILLQVFYANYSIWLLFAVHALMQIILHYFDHSVAWIVSFYFKKGGSSLNFDIRFISVYLVYPTLLWLGSLLLGCYESIPESRGLKLHYQSKSTWELVSKCFSDVFLEHKC